MLYFKKCIITDNLLRLSFINKLNLQVNYFYEVKKSISGVADNFPHKKYGCVVCHYYAWLAVLVECHQCVFSVLWMFKTCGFYLRDSGYAEDEEKNLATFFFQILNWQAEREQSCVLKQWDAKIQKVGSLLSVVTLKKVLFWTLYAEGVTSHDAKTVLSLFIP